MINKIIMAFITFCCMSLGGIFLYILTEGFGIPFALASGVLVYFIADKLV